MTVTAYLPAVVCIVVVVGGTVSTARQLAWRLMPTATPAVRSAATVVISYAVLVVVGEILGTAGVLSRWPITATLAGLAVLSRLTLPGVPALSRPRRTVTPAGVVAAVAVALLAAQALASIRSIARTGILFVDALDYHLPWAAFFAQTHSTTSLVHFGAGEPTAYYPLNSELLHGMGMAVVGRDWLSLLLAAVDVAAAVVTAYAVGARWDRGPVAVCALAPLLCILGAYDAQAVNDWTSIWPLLAMVAVAAHAVTADGRLLLSRGEAAVCGLAGGLAIGTKLNVVAPVVVLALGLVVLSRARRSTALLLAAAGLVTGGYWFVRDLVAVGTPVPGADLPGRPHVPMSVVDTYGYTVAHYLFDGAVWRHYFLPGFRVLFGPAWPVLLAAAALGLAAALRSRPRGLATTVAVAAAAGIAVYVVTPTTAFGPPGRPALFGLNLRYVWPSLALGLVWLASTRAARSRPAWMCAALLALTAVTMTGRLPWRFSTTRTSATAAAVALVVAGAALALGTARPARVGRRATAGAAVLAVLAVAGAGYPAQRYYLHHRYRDPVGGLGPAYAFVAALPPTSVGVIGTRAQYPFYGPQLRNRVRYLGETRARHAFEDLRTCGSLRAAAAHVHVVVVAPPTYAADAWMRRDPLARLAMSTPDADVFVQQPGMSTAGC